jgi:protein SCO1/2
MSDSSSRSRRGWLLGAGAAATAAAAGGLAFVTTHHRPDELRGLGEGVDAVVLTTHRDERIRWGDLVGAPRAVFFGFTHCPVICPVTVYELTAALDRVGAAAAAISVQFVTVDPARDTSQRLAQYLSGFGERVSGFTGDATAIAAMTQAFRVETTRTELANGNYAIDHTTTVFLLDRGGGVVDLVAYGSAPDLIDARLIALASA